MGQSVYNKNMRTVFEEYSCLYEIERSKFYGFIFHLDKEEDFKPKLKAIQKLKPKATHYCYAYVLENKQKSNDDGEPGGTAGMPILETIKNNDLVNVAVVVVRCFGGIKLGAGGLVRAYSHTANMCCKEAKVEEVLELPIYELVFDYNLINIVDKELKDCRVLSKDFGESVTYQVALNDEAVLKNLINICNGRIQIKNLGSQRFIGR